MTAKRGDQLDPITFELLSAALHAAAVEMGGVLKRSSYSPIIREMDDFSCAVFRADGDLVAQADFIPAQLGAMSLVVKAIIDRWGGRAVPGDAFLANHPYLGAMHTPDLNVIMPVFTGRKLFGWVGTTAHHIDVGGVRPGTEGPDLEQVYAEGLLLPPVRLYRAGEENPTCSTWWRRRSGTRCPPCPTCGPSGPRALPASSGCWTWSSDTGAAP